MISSSTLELNSRFNSLKIEYPISEEFKYLHLMKNWTLPDIR